MTERKCAYPHAYVSWSKKILLVETSRANGTEEGQRIISWVEGGSNPGNLQKFPLH
jgi:hypothetical protein